MDWCRAQLALWVLLGQALDAPCQRAQRYQERRVLGVGGWPEPGEGGDAFVAGHGGVLDSDGVGRGGLWPGS